MFKQLYPKAKCVELKAGLKYEEAKKQLDECTDTNGGGVGVYLIETPKRADSGDKVVDKIVGQTQMPIFGQRITGGIVIPQGADLKSIVKQE